MDSPLIEKVENEVGKSVYKMKPFDIDVVARLTDGIAPTISYLLNDKDVTDAIRFHSFSL